MEVTEDEGAGSPEKQSTAEKSSPVSVKPRLRLKQPTRVNENLGQSPKNETPTEKVHENALPEVNPDGQKRQIPTRITIKSNIDEEYDVPIEEQIILRLPSEKVANQVRELLKTKCSEEDLKLTFSDPRHASMFIAGEKYKATLVDLPCIIESQKTHDLKQLNKTADICQMLVVEPIDEAQDENRNEWEKTPPNYAYPHGLTAPLYNVRKRRFMKRASRSLLEDIESSVLRLLKADLDAEHIIFEISCEDPKAQNIEDWKNDHRSTTAQEQSEGRKGEINNDLDDREDNNSELADSIDAALEEALAEQEGELTDDDEYREYGIDEVDSVTSLEEDAETSQYPEQNSAAENINGGDKEHKQDALSTIGTLENEVEDMERKLADAQSHLSEQINPIMKDRFKDTIKHLETQLSEKRSRLEDIKTRIDRNES